MFSQLIFTKHEIGLAKLSPPAYFLVAFLLMFCATCAASASSFACLTDAMPGDRLGG
ncbi:hypothetical protein PC129_g527 [Phytophthora cactorum]|uniref:Uncharacterized protein n=1 Tax=Phytophthora cactorum TaxID=29920 RepID=A0A8T1J1C9_9STRA|nr:hypothetical protein PC129_g527 [Phytophthora cactorum]